MPSTEGAAPDSGRRFVPERDTQREMARIADARGTAWSLCHDLLGAPDEAVASRLREGEAAEELALVTAWLGEESGRFLPVQMALETYARRARRRTLEEDLAELTEGFRLAALRDLAWRSRLAEVAGQCETEARAWWAGDHESAKALRVAERDLVEEHLSPVVPEWAAEVDTSASPMIYRTVARLLVAHLSFETGRDFDRRVYGADSLLQWGRTGAEGPGGGGPGQGLL